MTLTASTAHAPSRALQGILCIEVGMLLFVIQDAMMKGMLEVFPVWFLIFARSAVAVIVLTPLILALGGHHRIFTPLWPLHLARAVLITTGFSLFYTAFPFMGLAEITTIFFSAPLITALLAAVFLGETIGPQRIAALGIGFLGVLIAINPTGGGFSWIAVLPLFCALTYAISQIIARQIGERESSLTVGLHMLVYSGVMILPMGWGLNQVLDFGPEFGHLRWQIPPEIWSGWMSLFVLGLSGMIGHILIARAYQVTNASFIAPFDYTYLPIATVVAYVIFTEIPPANTLIGMSFIVLSGLFLAYRELRTVKAEGNTPVVSETVFAPGLALPPQGGEDEDATHL